MGRDVEVGTGLNSGRGSSDLSGLVRVESLREGPWVRGSVGVGVGTGLDSLEPSSKEEEVRRYAVLHQFVKRTSRLRLAPVPVHVAVPLHRVPVPPLPPAEWS